MQHDIKIKGVRDEVGGDMYVEDLRGSDLGSEVCLVSSRNLRML